MGLVPESVQLSMAGARTAQLTWTPCEADLGFTGVCFEAFDMSAAASASSDMKCLQLRVVRNPPPAISVSPGGEVVFTMGRRSSLRINGSHENCLQPIQIVAASALPAEMVMQDPTPVPAAGCNSIERLVHWKPAYHHGGLRAALCFGVIQTPLLSPQTCPERASLVSAAFGVV